MKCRLIWDDCTATAERRPTTEQDIEEDIHVEEFESEEELLNHLMNLLGYDEADLDFEEGSSTRDKIEKVLDCFDDPGDGYANILYVSIDGKELEGALPYDCIKDMDLEHCDVEDIIDVIKQSTICDMEDLSEKLNDLPF